jgi:predicted pyridoxine 5'-phosphate oxidase superfamily flavin-nucleotide-binding protein
MRRARPYREENSGSRGDLPGFVVALDDRTLLLPDRPGNKKLETLQNILENSNVALIFLCQDGMILCV